MAGSCIDHEARPLHVSRWDKDQSKSTSNNASLLTVTNQYRSFPGTQFVYRTLGSQESQSFLQLQDLSLYSNGRWWCVKTKKPVFGMMDLKSEIFWLQRLKFSRSLTETRSYPIKPTPRFQIDSQTSNFYTWVFWIHQLVLFYNEVRVWPACSDLRRSWDLENELKSLLVCPIKSHQGWNGPIGTKQIRASFGTFSWHPVSHLWPRSGPG